MVARNLRNKETYETSRTVLTSTNEDGDVGGRDEARSESGNGGDSRGGGELHGAER